MTAERLSRPGSQELDKILGISFPIPSDGFVRVVDYLGNDSSIVQAARVSYGEGTKTIHQDRGLIRYLMRHRHTTPFEMCEIKFHVRVPMDTWRQWIRHRTANVNEYSTRYSVAIDSTKVTSSTAWRTQSKANRQGSSGFLPVEIGKKLSEAERQHQERARRHYEERLAAGVAREQARKDLPLSTYTEAYWKIDLHNLLHFLGLRMDDRAQAEIGEYARVIGEEIVSRWCPIAWEAFNDYGPNSLIFSGIEQLIVKAIISGQQSEALRLAQEYGFLNPQGKAKEKNRELWECEEKLRKIGIVPPWRGIE